MSQPDRAKILDRIQKLMRLATNNPNEQEASSAAMQAVKLIIEHQFVLQDATPAAKPPSAPFSAPSQSDIFTILRKQQEDYVRRQQEAAKQRGTADQFEQWIRDQMNQR